MANEIIIGKELDFGNAVKMINIPNGTNPGDGVNFSQLSAVLGALVFQGPYNANTNTPNLVTPVAGAVDKGYMYVVDTAGTFFGEAVEIGDTLIANVNDPSSLSDWTILETNNAANLPTDDEKDAMTAANSPATANPFATINDLPTALPPNGAAGGDLSGMYPNPVIDVDVVDNTNLTNMAAWTLKLRNAATTGDPQDVKISALTDAASFGTGDKIMIEESTGELRKIDFDDLPGGGCQVVADMAAANALTGLSAGDCIIVENGFNVTPVIIYVRSTPDGTISNAAAHTYTVGYNASGIISDNTGGGDIITAIPANNTLYELQSNGSVISLQNMTNSSVGNSQRIGFNETTKDKLLRRFIVAGHISFEGRANSVYRFAIRTRTSGGSTSTLPTGQQILAEGPNRPVHVTISAQRFLADGTSVYLLVERLSGAGPGDITLKEYILNVESTNWRTNQ